MSDGNLSRRRYLQATSAAVAAAAVPTVAAADGDGWTAVETPVDGSLYDVEHTSAGAYAVGVGGVVVERTATGWRKVLDGGPTGNGNNLYGSDVTDDGERLWFVGSSGAIGEYDVETGSLNSHSAPMDVTNNFNDVAVTGEAGDANVYVAGDSGKVYYSFENGETGSWNYVTPGSGSAINAIDFHDDRKGHIVDGNKSVFHTGDGEVWNKVGLADANVNFYGVDSHGPDDVWISGGGGKTFHWTGVPQSDAKGGSEDERSESSGVQWIPADTGDAGLRDIEVTDAGDAGQVVGGGGKTYAYDGREWVQESTPGGENLKAVARGDVDLAVGAGGTVLER